MGENGEIPRGMGGNALGRTCFQAFLQTEVGCDLTSLAALRSIHMRSPELTRMISLRNSLYIFIFGILYLKCRKNGEDEVLS